MARAELLEQGWGFGLGLALLMVIPFTSDAGWLGGSSSNRKRVFSPGFIVLYAFVAVIELIALNHFYGSI